MLSNVAQAASAEMLLHGTNATNTAGATGTAVDITDYEGYLMVLQCCNVVTGSIAGKIQHSTTTNATDFADVTGATFTSVNTDNDVAVQKISVPANGLNKYIRYVGTITTGPAMVNVAFAGVKKYVP